MAEIIVEELRVIDKESESSIRTDSEISSEQISEYRGENNPNILGNEKEIH